MAARPPNRPPRVPHTPGSRPDPNDWTRLNLRTLRDARIEYRNDDAEAGFILIGTDKGDVRMAPRTGEVWLPGERYGRKGGARPLVEYLRSGVWPAPAAAESTPPPPPPPPHDTQPAGEVPPVFAAFAKLIRATNTLTDPLIVSAREEGKAVLRKAIADLNLAPRGGERGQKST